MKNIIMKWDEKPIQDDGCYTSDEFKEFARDVKKSLTKELAKYGINLPKYSIGHYDLSAFAERDGMYVYISYDVPRGEQPLDLEARDCMNGWLVRTAKSDTDYTGGWNNFCNTTELVDTICNLIAKPL